MFEKSDASFLRKRKVVVLWLKEKNHTSQ